VTRSRRKREREEQLEDQRARERRIPADVVTRGEPRRLGVNA
jgi:hypothetical protein